MLTKQTSHKTILVLMLTGVAIALCGCPWSMERQFEPAPKNQLITMFGRYQMEIAASLLYGLDMTCDIHFITIHRDTVRLDTIPVFVIDSICLVGTCLTANRCYVPTDVFSFFYDRDVAQGEPPPFTSNAKEMRLGEKLYAGRYSVNSDTEISLQCQENDLQAWFHARLLDRTTRATLASETKRVQFRIFTRRGVSMGS
jgi:hypothetical protein